MRDDWVEIRFKDVVDKVSTSKQKIKQKEYLPQGLYPVVDQGHEVVGGYTNDESRLLDCKLPAVVFGDHTKIVKLINFRFVPGADGTKVLEPKKFVLSQYLSHLTKILVHKIKDKGYARHYQHVEKENFPLAPLPEQRAIVAKIEKLFSDLDNGIANLKAAKAKLGIYRQAVLKKAFGGKFVKNKNTNGLPEGWSLVKISSLCEVVRGGSPRPAGDDRFYNGEIPFLKVADLTRDEEAYLKKHTFTIKKEGLKKTRYVDSNTLLLSNSGASLGVPKICTFPTTFNDGIAAFLGLEEEMLLYHYYFWNSKTKELRNINQGAAQPNLNTSLIGAIKIPIGPLKDIKITVQAIESRLSVCDKMAESIDLGLAKAEVLRQSILKKAFAGNLLDDTELAACRREPDWEPADKLLERIREAKA